MLLSIVTINFNNKQGLLKTIESVQKQTFRDFEHIIIDGGSTDGSVEVIEENKNLFSYWVSEKDNGIYHAMNKGLNVSTGRYVFFLNSADYLYESDILKTIFSNLDNQDVIYGNIAMIQNDDLFQVKAPAVIKFAYRYQHRMPMQPAMLIKNTLLKEQNGFDEGYRIIADVVLTSRIFINVNISYKYINRIFTVFDTGGISSKKENHTLIYEERRRLIQSEFPEYLQQFERIYSKGGKVILQAIKEVVKKVFNK